VLTNYRSYLGWMIIILVLALFLEPSTSAQTSEAAKKVMTLAEAVDFTLKNYPAVRASLERVKAAQAGVGLARTNYLPRADMMWQTNGVTDNKITGLASAAKTPGVVAENDVMSDRFG
jgi:outer membrane protein TolC